MEGDPSASCAAALPSDACVTPARVTPARVTPARVRTCRALVWPLGQLSELRQKVKKEQSALDSEISKLSSGAYPPAPACPVCHVRAGCAGWERSRSFGGRGLCDRTGAASSGGGGGRGNACAGNGRGAVCGSCLVFGHACVSWHVCAVAHVFPLPVGTTDPCASACMVNAACCLLVNQCVGACT